MCVGVEPKRIIIAPRHFLLLSLITTQPIILAHNRKYLQSDSWCNDGFCVASKHLSVQTEKKIKKNVKWVNTTILYVDWAAVGRDNTQCVFK